MDAEQQTEVLNKLMVSMSFMIESNKRIEKILEGNGKPGLMEDVRQLRQDFEVHKQWEKACPLVTDVRNELDQISGDVQDHIQSQKNKEEKLDDRNFTMKVEKKKFWNGATLSIALLFAGQIFTIIMTIATYIKELALK